MLYCKFCTIEDYATIVSIIDNKNLISGIIATPEDKEKHKSLLKERIDKNDPLARIVGCYTEEGILKAFCNIRLWENYPFWSCSNMFIDNDDKTLNLSYYNNGFIDLLRYSQQYAESKGYFEQYYCADMRIYRTYEKLFSKGLQRYDYVAEAFYNKNDKFKFKHHSALCSWVELAPYDCVICKTILKQEYRKLIVFQNQN